jgi:hypothetical protein
LNLSAPKFLLPEPREFPENSVALEFYWYPTHSAEISEKQVLRLHFVPLRRMGHGGLPGKKAKMLKMGRIPSR